MRDDQDYYGTDVWHPRSKSMEGIKVMTALKLTQAQADSIAELAGPLKPEEQVEITQTHTESGGLHLYARRPDGYEVHIAKSGRPQKMGTLDVT